MDYIGSITNRYLDSLADDEARWADDLEYLNGEIGEGPYYIVDDEVMDKDDATSALDGKYGQDGYYLSEYMATEEQAVNRLLYRGDKVWI